MTGFVFKAALLSTLIACSTTVFAHKNKHGDKYYEYQDKARVIHVEPHYAKADMRANARHCRTKNVRHSAQYDKSPSYTTTIAGAVLGGVIGNQLGHGRGKTLMTVAGTVLGGVAGYHYENTYQESRQQGQIKTQPCLHRAIHHANPRGYKVTYRYRGKVYHRHVDYRPGKFILVNTRGNPSESYF